MSASRARGAESEHAPERRTLEAAIGHRFGDPDLLDAALTHASYANEHAGVQSNERLEFLGDAVLGASVARLLYDARPDWQEGDLTRALSRLVDRNSLASLARRYGLGPHLRLGRTERQSRGEEKESILADAMEAIFAAVHLDAGMDAVVALARHSFGDALDAEEISASRDPKTALQERVMARDGHFPTYTLLEDSGQEGDPVRFRVAVVMGDAPYAEGVGRSKRLAEKAAASVALERLDGDDPPTAEARRAKPAKTGSTSD